VSSVERGFRGGFSPISPLIIGCFRFLFHFPFSFHPSLSFSRQKRSTLLHVSFFRSSDAFFCLADAFYCTSSVVLSFVRRFLSFGRPVLFCVYVNFFHGSINYLSFVIDNLSLTIDNFSFCAVLSSGRRFKYKSSF